MAQSSVKIKNECSYKDITIPFALIGLVMGVLLVIYFCKFNGGLSIYSNDWGNFGDFLGGIGVTLLTALNVYIFYRLTRQMNERTNENAIEQQRINSIIGRAEVQRFIYRQIDIVSVPIIKGEDKMDKALVSVRNLYFLLNCSRFNVIFSNECETKRVELCELIQPIIGLDENGDKAEATKKNDNKTWDELRNKLIVLEVFINKAMIEGANSLVKDNEETTHQQAC